ncbi:MAG: arsenate reductase ArsC [Armatimonadetes bacterium]|nr:arsenate reductase ArsC [Armatimonadota bacterium]
MAAADPARPRVLFLCTGNSCRSQIAEGWLRHLAGDRFEALSAGVEAHGLNPLAVAVMAEAGVDISGQSSDLVERYAATPIAWFVTVCDHAQAACPVTPQGSAVLHWSFADPPALARQRGLEGEAAKVIYRQVRDEIREAVADFAASH